MVRVFLFRADEQFLDFMARCIVGLYKPLREQDDSEAMIFTAISHGVWDSGANNRFNFKM